MKMSAMVNQCRNGLDEARMITSDTRRLYLCKGDFKSLFLQVQGLQRRESRSKITLYSPYPVAIAVRKCVRTAPVVEVERMVGIKETIGHKNARNGGSIALDHSEHR